MALQASTTPFPTANIDQGLTKPSRPGKSPRLRLHNAGDAYQIAATLVRAAIPRIERGRMVRGLLDGNPPRSPAALRRQAQDWRANFNTLEGRALVGNAKTPYYDLFSAVMPVVEVDLDSDESARDTWNRVAAEEFHCFLYSYASLEPSIWGMLDDFVVFNKGFLWHPDPIDPFFKRLPWWRVMFPNGTEMDPEEWNQFAVRQYWVPVRLWEVSGRGEGENWNGDAVVAAIQRATPLQPQSQQAEGIEIQQMLKDCDVLLSARSEVVRTVSIFTKEYEGKWSWHMVEEDAAMQAVDPDEKSGRQGVEDEEPRFMFAAPRVFDSPQEILSTFIYEPEEGSINAFSGLGKQLFQLLRSKDIIEMGLLDGAILRQYPMLQPASAADAQKTALIQAGPCHILAPGTQVIQTNLLADLEGSLAVMQHLEQQIESNTAIFKPRLEKPQGNPETATAASLRWQNATVLTSSAVNRFYAQGDRWIQEVWRRATSPDLPRSSTKAGIKAALLFQDRCKERGIPLEVLHKKPYDLHLARAMGNGSAIARQQGISAMSPLVAEMGPRGRRAYLDMYTAAFLGNKAVNKIWPQADVLGLPDTNTWMAEQENEYMHQGAEPTITDGQDHRVHARSHLQAVASGMQAIQQGADPALVLAFAPVALQHTAKHVAALPKAEQPPYAQAISQLFQQYQEIAGKVQKMQEAQAKRQGQAQKMLSEQDIAMMEIQLDAQRKDAKQNFQLQQRAQKHQQDLATADASVAAGIQAQTAQTTSAIANERAKTAADIANARIKAEADAAATRAKAQESKE